MLRGTGHGYRQRVLPGTLTVRAARHHCVTASSAMLGYVSDAALMSVGQAIVTASSRSDGVDRTTVVGPLITVTVNRDLAGPPQGRLPAFPNRQPCRLRSPTRR